MFVLAHLSDPHLGPLPRPRLSELASKRLLGFVNWRLRRDACHRSDIFTAILEDMNAARPDHVAVTGDLINISLEREFAPARAVLARLGAPDRVTLVPGNHDVYVRATAHCAARDWAEYMRGDDVTADDPATPSAFPFVRRRGPIALIGLSSALPTGPLKASGRLGPEQTARLADLLAQLADSFRVVLIHHPPLGRRPRHKRLTDAAPLLRVLAAHGAELVLHGHDHRDALEWATGPHGRIPVVGVPSSSAAPGMRHDDPAAYHLYRIDGRPGAWRCEMISRGLSADAGAIGERARRTLIG